MLSNGIKAKYVFKTVLHENLIPHDACGALKTKYSSLIKTWLAEQELALLCTLYCHLYSRCVSSMNNTDSNAAGRSIAGLDIL